MITIMCSTFVTYYTVLIQFQLVDNVARYIVEKMSDVIRLLCLAVFSHLASHNLVHG